MRELVRERLPQDFLTSVWRGGFSMSWYEVISVLTSIRVRRVLQKLDEIVNNLKNDVLLCTTTTLKNLDKLDLYLKCQSNLKSQ